MNAADPVPGVGWPGRWRARGPAVPDLARHPLRVEWELTDSRGQPAAVEAPWLVDQLAELEPGEVVLGGPALLGRRDLPTIVAEAADRGLGVTLAPGAAPVAPEAIAALAAAGASGLVVRLDGAEAVHAESALDMAARGRASGLRIEIETAVDGRTLAGLRRTAALVREISPALWRLAFAVSRDALSAAACEEAFHFLYDWSIASRLDVDTVAAPAYRRVVVERERRRRGPTTRRRRPRPLPVSDGKGLLFIAHTGEVFPSRALPLGAGSVYEDRLADVYRRGRLFRALRATWRLEGRCGVCRFQSICGGSRARAYAATGNFLAEDPACAYRPEPNPRPALRAIAHGDGAPSAGRA